MDDRTLEILAARVHKAYCEEYERQNGQPHWTGGDYDKLDESAKEFDRVTVRAIISFNRFANADTGPQKPHAGGGK